MADIKTIIDKINKLRALSTSSNEHEAAAAAAAADKLIQEHGLVEAQLESEGVIPKEAVAQDESPFASWREKRVPQWQRALAWGLVHHYNCSGIEANMRGRVYEGQAAWIRIVGRKSDIEAARYMYAYLTVEIERLAQNNRGNGRHWLDSFRHGCVHGCLYAMKQAKEQVKKAAPAAASAAIVLVDSRKDEAIDLLHKLYPKRGRGHVIGARGGSGYAEGHKEGRKLADQHDALQSAGGTRQLKS